MIGRLLRRALVVCFAFLIAASAGALLLPLAVLFDPVLREIGLNAVGSALSAAMDDASPESAAVLGRVLWAVPVAVCAAPLAFTVLLGEIAGMRSLAWYGGASGALAAASPWILRASRGLPGAVHASPLELRVAVLFFVIGGLTGAVYWLIAARGAR